MIIGYSFVEHAEDDEVLGSDLGQDIAKAVPAAIVSFCTVWTKNKECATSMLEI